MSDERAVCVGPDGRVVADPPPPPLLLCGSFNPLHAGHLGMAEAAERLLGLPAAFEISVTNVEKPPLSDDETRRRAGQFAGRVLWLTRAPTYVEKAELFPGTVFLVGADTAARVIEARFYDGDVAAALDAVRRRGCRFLVAGRVHASGGFVEADGLAIPEAARDLFAALPGFRLDVSSTMLRNGRSLLAEDDVQRPASTDVRPG